MPHVYHSDLYDKGLNELVNEANAGTLQMALCKGLPASRAEVTADITTTGKRITPLRTVTLAEAVLANRGGGGREVTIAAKGAGQGNGNALATTVQGDDLFFAFIGSARLLAVLDEPGNQAITSGNEMTYPQLKIGFGAP